MEKRIRQTSPGFRARDQSVAQPARSFFKHQLENADAAAAGSARKSVSTTPIGKSGPSPLFNSTTGN